MLITNTVILLASYKESKISTRNCFFAYFHYTFTSQLTRTMLDDSYSRFGEGVRDCAEGVGG